MGLIDRLKTVVSSDEGATRASGVEYQCANCGEMFDTAREHCPNCGAEEIRERGSFEFEPDDEEPAATKQ